MNEDRTTIRGIMRKLAADIRDGGGAAAPMWPAGIKAPIVYLDGIADEWEPTPEEEGAPVIVVTGTADSHDESGGDYTWTIEILVAMDCSSPDANQVPSHDPGDGIRITGAGERFEATVNGISNIVRHSRPGAILRQMDRQWSFHSLPVQFAVITLSYTSPQTFEDTDDIFPTDFN